MVYFEHKICLCYSIWDLFSEPIPRWNFRFSADRTCVCPSCCCCSTSYLPDIPQTISNLIELSCWLRRWNWILIEANISKWIFPFFPALVVAVHFESVCVLAWVCVCVRVCCNFNQIWSKRKRKWAIGSHNRVCCHQMLSAPPWARSMYHAIVAYGVHRLPAPRKEPPEKMPAKRSHRKKTLG